MIHYFLEVSIAWALFYAIYYIFLKKETFFNVNRWYLLHTIWIGAVIPLIRKIPISLESVEPLIMQPVQAIHYTTYAVSEAMTVPAEDRIFNFQFALYGIYFLGILFFSFKFYHGLKNIWRLWKSGEKVAEDDFTLVLSDSYHLPFSFLKYVFLHRSFLKNDSIREIIDHEMIHVKSRHTLDVLFFEIISILFWWNPIIYLYKKELRQTHEYVADAYASQSTHIKNYGQILLGQSSSGIELALTNQFFNSHLKKRITMLYKKKSARYKIGKYLLFIPILFFLCVLYSFKNNPDGSKRIIKVNSGLTMVVNDITAGLTEDCETCEEDIKKPEIPKELLRDINISLAKFQLDDYQVVAQEFKRLIEKYPDNEVYRDFVHDRFSEQALLHNVDIEFSYKDNENLSYCMKMATDLRLVMLNQSEELVVGETYEYRVVNANKKERLDVLINPALGRVSSPKKVQGIENQYSFTFTPKTATQVKTIASMKVISGSESTEMLFKVIDGRTNSVKKINAVSKENTTVKVFQNSPNPFRKTTTITFELDQAGAVEVFIYNIKNEVVKSYEGNYAKGQNEIVVKANDLPEGGVYYYNLVTSDFSKTMKMVYVENEEAYYEKETGVLKDTLPHMEEHLSPLSEDTNEEKIYRVVQEMPRITGCEELGLEKDEKSKCSEKKLLEWVYSHLEYPAEAKEKKLEGKVYVQFVIDKDGSITDPKVVRDIGGGCGQAALNMLKEMSQTKWIPGKQGGKPVRVYFTLPIKFELESEENKLVKFNVNESHAGLDCTDPITIVDGQRVNSVLDVDTDDIKEIKVYKNDVPEKYAKYENACGIIEVITKNPKLNRNTKDRNTVPTPPPPPLNSPPPPPPSPDQAIMDFLEDCENPGLILNGEDMPFELFDLIDRSDYQGLRISGESDPSSKYSNGSNCGVIHLNTKNPKTINQKLREIFTSNSESLSSPVEGYVMHKCTPNPFTEMTAVGFEIPKDDNLEFSIYDMNNRIIKKFDSKIYNKGYNELELKGSYFPAAGNYIIIMRYGKSFIANKINYINGRD